MAVKLAWLLPIAMQVQLHECLTVESGLSEVIVRTIGSLDLVRIESTGDVRCLNQR